MIDFATPTDKHLPNHRVEITSPGRTLASVALIALLFLFASWLDEKDARIAQAEADRAAATARANIRDTTATVRLVPQREGGWTCEQMHVRREYALAVGQKCAELAALLIVGRATP